ncbi:MAG: VOC family protein [Actinomycetota bacterium]|nr:VOC family protein [Actinomycetota bacterium]
MADEQAQKFIWPCLNYTDARTAMRYLVDVLGFEETALYTAESGDVVTHAEARWPEGGGVMFGSAGREDSEFSTKAVGASSVYVITDDPDSVYERAISGGAEITREMEEADYGSRGFTVRDPEGNLFSFGTYKGE